VFDFRYHALSIAAVFLALGIGIVLGVTIGDSLVSEADQNIRESLRGDVVDARRDLREAEAGVRRRDQIIDAMLPVLARNRLRGERVALVAWGSLPESVEASVRDAVEAGGGRLDSVSDVADRLELRELEGALGARFRGLARDVDVLRAAGERIGLSIVRGGPLARRLRRELPELFRGGYAGAEAVAFYHSPDADERRESGDEAERRKELERALISGLRDEGVPVVGVEETGTEPSQVRFYEDRDLSSVDSVDTVGGRLALVLTLAGARGKFGFKETADEPIPELRRAG
jgi:hypothetical protein